MQGERRSKGNLKTIKCECGAQILCVPHVESMVKVIKNHVQEHKDKEKDNLKAQLEAERIEGLLIKLLFEEIAQK